jgi:hypothetical protein
MNLNVSLLLLANISVIWKMLFVVKRCWIGRYCSGQKAIASKQLHASTPHSESNKAVLLFHYFEFPNVGGKSPLPDVYSL